MCALNHPRIRRARYQKRVNKTPTNTAPATPTFTQSLQHGELSSQEMVQLQHVVGNHAMQQLTDANDPRIRPRDGAARTPTLPPDFLGLTPRASTDTTLVQRLPTSVKFDANVTKEVKKAGKKQAKQKEKVGDKKDPKQDGGIFSDVMEYVEDVVDTVVSGLQQNAYKDLLEKLDHFHIYHKEYKKLKPDYMDLGGLLWYIKEVEKASSALLLLLKNDDPRTEHVQKLHDDAVELFIAQSPNAERAKALQKKLKSKQSDHPERINEELVSLLVMAVAMPRDLFNDKGQAGVIGIDHALNAVDALVLLSDSDYEKIMGLLAKSGDDWGEVAQKATLLKALAARKKDLEKAGPQTEKAIKQMGEFAEAIRGMDRDELLEATTVSDRGSGTGLQQRYTMSCGPTSIQIVKAEIDPIYALSLTKQADGIKSLKTGVPLADEQKKMLEKANKKKGVAFPRNVSMDVKKDWDKMGKAVTAHINGIKDNAEKLKANKAIGAVVLYLQKKPYNAAQYTKGVTLLKTVLPGVDVDKRLPEWRTHYVSLSSGMPGLKGADVEMLLKDQLSDTSDEEFKMITTFTKGKKKVAWKVNKHMATIDKALFEGKQVPFAVLWSKGGGHVMVLVDMKGKKKGTAYLIAEPWRGQSYWISRKDFIAGKFKNAGLSSDGNVAYVYL